MQFANIAIVGGGPAGLMAAEILAKAGHNVTIYDHMPSFGRKFLMAGRGGLNLTHSEPQQDFITRYGASVEWLKPYLESFGPEQLRQWCEGLGQETFVGSSGRIFPKAMKAAPLLRAWLKRLADSGVRFAPRHRLVGWNGNDLRFETAHELIHVTADATLLALGGASWPRLGSDGNWVGNLAKAGVDITPLQPANCGVRVAWSDHFRDRFAGTPLKPVRITLNGASCQGEAIITREGLEGGALYALSSVLRDTVDRDGQATLHLDLRPAMTQDALTAKLGQRGSQSLSTYLKRAGFHACASSLLRETLPADIVTQSNHMALAALLKSLPVAIHGMSGMARAISTAGGIAQNAVDAHCMLHAKPGVFVAGEMLDWEAPTGGYLLQGCFSTAVAAANGMLDYLKTGAGA